MWTCVRIMSPIPTAVKHGARTSFVSNVRSPVPLKTSLLQMPMFYHQADEMAPESQSWSFEGTLGFTHLECQ